ncbi:TIGR03643 family protein [Lewinella sp. IMCC34183]|uniref:TIGR03643 family protein n=1 Tax=Lewinella sp. IMCC34183 TaxID=2248762 RepID=UPI000E261179|nr:TIGR03643 family protein [Lewinella sp. IMCC34183]
MNDSLSLRDIDRVIEMAWEDRTPFSAIEFQFGLAEPEVIELMRRELKPGSFKRWRARVQGRSTKHRALRQEGMTRFKSDNQRTISHNRKSKD